MHTWLAVHPATGARRTTHPLWWMHADAGVVIDSRCSLPLPLPLPSPSLPPPPCPHRRLPMVSMKRTSSMPNPLSDYLSRIKVFSGRASQDEVGIREATHNR